MSTTTKSSSVMKPLLMPASVIAISSPSRILMLPPRAAFMFRLYSLLAISASFVVVSIHTSSYPPGLQALASLLKPGCHSLSIPYTCDVRNHVQCGGPMYSIIVHGGVGAVSHDKEEAVIAGVRGAVIAGSDVLASSGSSLDAVETAIKILEDNPLFNCGTGSVLTFDGEVEMDAAVAYGPALGFGAVAGIKNIQHPISLARMVMEKTDHVLLQGSGAQELSLIHISEPTRLGMISYAVFCLK